METDDPLWQTLKGADERIKHKSPHDNDQTLNSLLSPPLSLSPSNTHLWYIHVELKTKKECVKRRLTLTCTTL